MRRFFLAPFYSSQADVHCSTSSAGKVAEIKLKVKEYQSKFAVEKRAEVSELQAVTAVTGKKTVQVYWNVIQSGTATSQGNIPASAISSQIAVLNRDYGNYGFNFVLAATKPVTNAGWFNNASRTSIASISRPVEAAPSSIPTATDYISPSHDARSLR